MKVLGVCENCGAPYPVEVFEDRSLHVLGPGAACECGSREFSIVTDGVDDATG